MKTQRGDILLIEDYLDNKLSNKESRDFQERLAKDNEFKALFNLREKLKRDLLLLHEYESTSNKVKFSIKRAKKKKQKLIIYSVAASIILLLSIPGIYLYTPKQNNEIPIAMVDSISVNKKVPQINVPEHYAEKGKYLEFHMTNITESEDSIHCEFNQKVFSKLQFLVLGTNDSILISTTLEIGTKGIGLNKGSLQAGVLRWQLKELNQHGHFELNLQKRLVGVK